MKKKILWFCILLLIVVGAVIFALNKKRSIENLSTPQVPLPAVMIAKVQRGDINITSHYMGTIEPYIKSELSSRISGSILSISKREGDYVKKGEVLVNIDDRELVDKIGAVNAELQSARQRYAGAKSAYETQKAIYERDTALFKVGAISQEAMDRSRSAYDGAKATLDAYEEAIKGLNMSLNIAKTQAGYAHITAPFDAVITKRWAEPGDMALPGKAILSIEDTSSYKVIAQIPQEEILKIKKGSQVTLAYEGQTMTAKISRIYPSLAKNLLGSIEITLPSSPFKLPSYSTIGVDIVTGKAEGLVVPEQAVVKNSKGAFVYLIKDDVVNIKTVRLLGLGEGRAVIDGQVQEGDDVAVAQENKLLSLTEGSKVKPITPAQNKGGKK